MALQEWALKREQDDEVGKRETGLKACMFFHLSSKLSRFSY